MREFLSLLVISFCFFALAHSSEFPFLGKVNSDGINLRAEPNVRTESIAKLKRETKLKVLSERFDWYKVNLPKTAVCFINRKYVKSSTLANEGIVTADKVNLRALPSQNAAIIGQINKDQIFRIVKAEPDWYAIYAPQEAFGWVHKKFIDYYSEFNAGVVDTRENLPQEELNKKQAKIEISPVAAGLIKPMGIFFKRRGTHRLIVDGKTAYYLRADDKDLLNNYSGYKVNIFGQKIDTPSKKIPLIAVEKIEIIK